MASSSSGDWGSSTFGKLSRGLSAGVQSGVSGLLSVNALLNDSQVRQKAGELLHRTAKQVLPENALKPRRGRAGHHRRARSVVQQEEAECDLQVGQQLYERVPVYMRTQLWKSLLLHSDSAAKNRPAAAAAAAAAAAEPAAESADVKVCDSAYYNHLLELHVRAFVPDARRTGWEGSAAETIFKDVRRTFPRLAMFASDDGIAALWRVLRAYALHDPVVGYCQGMNFVAGLLLLHLDEPSAFAVFDEERNNAALTLLLAPGGAAMRGMYAPDMALLHLRLRQLDRLLFVHAHALHVHLEQAAASILIFTSPWLLSMFASEFPINFAGRVMDVALAERSYAIVLRVALQILIEAQTDVLAIDDFELLIEYFKRQVPCWSRDRLNRVLNDAVQLTDLSEEMLQSLALQLDEEAKASASSRGNPHLTESTFSPALQSALAHSQQHASTTTTVAPSPLSRVPASPDAPAMPALTPPPAFASSSGNATPSPIGIHPVDGSTPAGSSSYSSTTGGGGSSTRVSPLLPPPPPGAMGSHAPTPAPAAATASSAALLCLDTPTIKSLLQDDWSSDDEPTEVEEDDDDEGDEGAEGEEESKSSYEEDHGPRRSQAVEEFPPARSAAEGSAEATAAERESSGWNLVEDSTLPPVLSMDLLGLGDLSIIDADNVSVARRGVGGDGYAAAAPAEASTSGLMDSALPPVIPLGGILDSMALSPAAAAGSSRHNGGGGHGESLRMPRWDGDADDTDRGDPFAACVRPGGSAVSASKSKGRTTAVAAKVKPAAHGEPMRRPVAHGDADFGEFKAAPVATMHPLPAGLFSPQPGTTAADARDGCSAGGSAGASAAALGSSPELFGDFVDLWAELKKGQHQELGYSTSHPPRGPPSSR